MQFIDLSAQQEHLREKINANIAGVLEHCRFILGPEVAEFERNLADFVAAKHALGCANGTDAILLPLMAWGIGAGDAVFCPSFTYCATAEVIALCGATPVFVDIDRQTYNLKPDSLRQAIKHIRETGQLTPKAVIAVDLFGQIADYPSIAEICQSEGLSLIADSAQGLGSTLHGAHPLNWADVQTSSFFPAKPLGCYGDGGAVLTNDDDLFARMKSLHFHGRSDVPFDHQFIGLNSRLDTIQAAILLPKLEIFAEEIELRNRIASRYSEALCDHVTRTPLVMDGAVSTWAQYTIEVPTPQALADALSDAGIPTARYYPRPVHMQTAYADFPVSGNGLPNTNEAAKHVVSLPMHPYLSEDDQTKIISAIISSQRSSG